MSGTQQRRDGISEPVFRTAVDTDTEALVALVNSAYRGDSSRQGWTTEADLLGGQRADAESMAELIARPLARVLVAEAGEDLIACCELQHSGHDAYFGMFSVSPRLQGAGVGKCLLAHAEGYAARTWGCERMRMKVIRQRSELIAWYERRGYKDTGQSSPFPYGDERFGRPKRPDLVFAELVKDLPPTG